MTSPGVRTAPTGVLKPPRAVHPLGDDGLSKYDSLAGSIFAPHLPRENALDRMEEHILDRFDGFDYAVPNDELLRIGNLPPQHPRQFFACCMKFTAGLIYRTTIYKPFKKELVDYIWEDINHRLAFALAMGVTELLPGQIDMTLAAVPAPPKKRSDFFLFLARRLFCRYGWGWDARLLKTNETYALELERPHGLPVRNEYFPVYRWKKKGIDDAKRMLEAAEKKQLEKEKDAEMSTKEFQQRRAERFKLASEIVSSANAAFREQKIGSLGTTFRISAIASKFQGDPDRLRERLDVARRKSLELMQLSGKQFRDAALELHQSGWRQNSAHPRLWLPPDLQTSGLVNGALPEPVVEELVGAT